MTSNYAHEYRKQAVQTASPLELVVMLYDGALRFMEAGKQAMADRDNFRKNDQLQRAQKIVTELMCCLDMQQGGEIAQNLFAIYSYVHNTLVEANVAEDPGKIDECVAILSQLRDGWAQIHRDLATKAEATRAA